ncbi:MAG: hypothetical protein ACUVTX_03340 [Bacteroidales bacterium]
MEYVFPGQGFEDIKVQFMLIDTVLVAPALQKGIPACSVKLPELTKDCLWEADDGKIYNGGRTTEVDVPLSRLPYFCIVNK